MNLTSLVKGWLLVGVVSLTMTTGAIADLPPLSHADAAKIVTNSGYMNVTVAYVSVNLWGTTVVGTGYVNGLLKTFSMTLQYDHELGYFYTNGVDINETEICTVQGIEKVHPLANPYAQKISK
jgi:hypothetical protein